MQVGDHLTISSAAKLAANIIHRLLDFALLRIVRIDFNTDRSSALAEMQ